MEIIFAAAATFKISSGIFVASQSLDELPRLLWSKNALPLGFLLVPRGY